MRALTAATLFLACYALTIVITSVGYHRGLTHGAVRLRPWFRELIVTGGHWLTGIDPQTWVVMHRLHHRHSDGPGDPHSPVNVGFWGIPWEQIKSYARILSGLRRKDPALLAVAPDMATSWPVAAGLWFLPIALHGALAIALGLGFDWTIGLAYWAGMMSHGTQGVVINALGHSRGGRNFELEDQSRNNHLAAWLVLGEGFQNNHHRFPASACFAYLRSELDLGYGVCRAFEALGLLEINRSTLIPRPR